MRLAPCSERVTIASISSQRRRRPRPGLPRHASARSQPCAVSTLTASMRDFFGNSLGQAPRDTFPAEHPVLLTVLWCIGIVAIFAPLAVRRYRASSR